MSVIQSTGLKNKEDVTTVSYKNKSKSFIKIIGLIFKEKFLLKKNVFPSSFFYTLMIDNLKANMIMSLNSKIVTGILVDKPIFSILKYYKKENQKVCSLNEFFHFEPYYGFDYNNLDVYFYMNNYDKDSQNLIGGKIDTFKQVRFFRNYLKSNSKGISESLNITINKYNKV